VTLYFLSLDTKQLVAENRQIAWANADSDRIRQLLLALIQGSNAGHRPALSPSTEIRAVFLTSEGTAYVDFSKDLLSKITPGIACETLTVYSIVNSLTSNIPAVKRVKLLIEGKEVETLDGHTDLTDSYVADPAFNAPAS